MFATAENRGFSDYKKYIAKEKISVYIFVKSSTSNISIRHPQREKDKSGSCTSASTAESSQMLLCRSKHKDIGDLAL